MSFKKYGVFTKKYTDGYMYILQQFYDVKNKKHGVYYYTDTKELLKVFGTNYELAKSITEDEAIQLQKEHRIGILESGKELDEYQAMELRGRKQKKGRGIKVSL